LIPPCQRIALISSTAATTTTILDEIMAIKQVNIQSVILVASAQRHADASSREDHRRGTDAARVMKRN